MKNGGEDIHFLLEKAYAPEVKPGVYEIRSNSSYYFDFAAKLDSSFLSNIPYDKRINKIYSLLKDSVYYTPVLDTYSFIKDKNIIYPKKKMNVYFHPQSSYTLKIDNKKYYFVRDSIIDPGF